MKKVLAIYAEGEFKQFLLKSEARYISQMCEAWKEVTVKLEEISQSQFDYHFGISSKIASPEYKK